MKPKISVAMTTYNGRLFLKEQLDSIAAQSRQVDELVVCDDGSADNTVGMLNKFKAAAPFPVRIAVNEKNLGCTKNFEKAISLCGGDIILLCDQDDVWLPHKAAVIEEMFLANPDCGMAFTDAVVVDEKNRPLSKLWTDFEFDKRRQRKIKAGNGFETFVRGNVVTGATAAVTKSFFEEARPFPADVTHDYWMAMAAVLKNKLFFNGAVTINYRKHSAQQIGTPPSAFFQKLKRIPDLDKEAVQRKVLREELDGRFHLTEAQNKLFADSIEFYRYRNGIRRYGLMRIPKIIYNLSMGNYHKFSGGFLSAGKDLIMKKS
jgi:glycosyltransferase involved in cell wall biosynthesis